MKNIENKCMLITYADSMGEKPEDSCPHSGTSTFRGSLAASMCCLSFPPPATGGFAVINYDTVDPALWQLGGH